MLPLRRCPLETLPNSREPVSVLPAKSKRRAFSSIFSRTPLSNHPPNSIILVWLCIWPKPELRRDFNFCCPAHLSFLHFCHRKLKTCITGLVSISDTVAIACQPSIGSPCSINLESILLPPTALHSSHLPHYIPRRLLTALKGNWYSLDYSYSIPIDLAFGPV